MIESINSSKGSYEPQSAMILEQQQMQVNVRIIVIISIFALFLITIGTVVLLNTYSPTQKSTRSQMRVVTKQKSSSISSFNEQSNTLSTLANTLRNESEALSKDEAQFEAIAGN